MKIELKTSVNVTEVTYIVEYCSNRRVIYKEWVNEKDKVIDCSLRNIDGLDIDCPLMLEMIQEYIDNLNP